jgi:hypothetical protein
MGDADPHGAGFSLELGDDLVEMRDWLHEFAASVIRPAAAEWDEREETPWPVLQEAAKIGLYSLDFYAQQYLEGSGLGIPVAFEEGKPLASAEGSMSKLLRRPEHRGDDRRRPGSASADQARTAGALTPARR